MQFRTFLTLGRARYRLQWASARRSPGGRAWFFIVQALIVSGILVAAIVGLGAAVASAATGEIERATTTILTTTFLNGLLASAVLGYGMNQTFSDSTLRRYPLTRLGRQIARHGLGLIEPLWLITLAIYLGVGVGVSALGPGSLWVSLPVVVLLAAGNYLLCRLLITGVDRASESPIGQIVMFVLIQTAVVAPALLRGLARHEDALALGERLVRLTPPPAAAAVLAGSYSPGDLLTIAAWPLFAFGALVLVDGRTSRATTRSRALSQGPGLIDWVAARLPGVSPPLAAKTLRFYLRNFGIRSSLAATAIIATYLIWRLATPGDARSLFAAALGISPLLGSMLTLHVDANPFGLEGSGTRRLWLSPLPPAQILRAVAIAPVIISAGYTVVVIAVWAAIAPIPVDARMIAMVLCAGLCGLLWTRTWAVWAAIAVPKPANYNERFKNRMTWPAQVIAFGLMAAMAAIGLTAASTGSPGVPSTTWWWVAPIALALSTFAFVVSEQGAERAFASRRERILTVVEGRA